MVVIAGNSIEDIGLEWGTLKNTSHFLAYYCHLPHNCFVFSSLSSVKAYKQNQVVLEQRWHHPWSQTSGWEPGHPVPRLVLHYLPTAVLCEMPRTFYRPKVGTSHQQRCQKADTGDSV